MRHCRGGRWYHPASHSQVFRDPYAYDRGRRLLDRTIVFCTGICPKARGMVTPTCAPISRSPAICVIHLVAFPFATDGKKGRALALKRQQDFAPPPAKAILPMRVTGTT